MRKTVIFFTAWKKQITNTLVFTAVSTISGVSVKTADESHAGTDDGIFMKVCNDISGGCCETKLDDTDRDDFVRNTTDDFGSNLIPDCTGLKIMGSGNSVVMRVEGSDGWLGESVTISLTDGRTISCSVSEWIDDDGSTTLSCSTQ